MQTLVNILLRILNVYEIILLARVLMSWFRPDPYNPIVRFLYNATEPILAPIREALPATGGIDFSPLVAFLLLFALQRVITILL
ncbi:MAG: YggT family protein [Aggregatilineales bacterium]